MTGDSIDKEISRSQIGKRREVAYEQMNHAKTPKTNLPPLKSIPKAQKKVQFGCQYERCNHRNDTQLFKCEYCGKNFCQVHQFYHNCHSD